MVLDDLRSVVDQLCATDPAALSDGESIQELHRCLARLEAATTRATAAFEAGGEWQADGARSSSAWLAARCGLPSSSARRRVRLGRELRHLPVAEAAWLAGRLGEAQVAALARARTPATEEAMARDEELLVAEATRLRFGSFIRVLAYWSQHADPDGTEDAAASGRAARRFHLSQSFEGMWFGDLLLDPISGAILAKALERIVDEVFEADWAEARARRAGRAPADGRRPEPLFTVLVGYESFAGRICQLANGSVVSPGALVPWLDSAWVERVVFDGPSRVIDVGVRRRLFDGSIRRAVQVRDRECFHDLCDEPSEGCEIDHIEPRSAGGETVAANGRAACGHHNRRRHRRP